LQEDVLSAEISQAKALARFSRYRAERETRKNSQLAAAQRVGLKMGRRLRCSSVTYPFRYAPSYRQSGSDRLAGGPFWTQRSPRDL